jgi:curli biogenesis system outer membrane secretion channel CsgG
MLRKLLPALIVGVFALCLAVPALAQDVAKDAADGLVKALLADATVKKLQGETLVLAPFKNVNVKGDDAMALFQEMLSTALEQGKFFKIVSSGQLNKALKDLGVDADALTDPDTQQALKEKLKANYLLTGSVIENNSRLVPTGRLIKLESGDTIATIRFDAAAKKRTGRKRIAVVNFEIPPDWHWSGTERLSAVLADMMITELVKAGTFDVIERTELEKILKEQGMSAEGVLDPASANKSGKVLGVDYILGGKITEFGIKKSGTGGFGAALGVGVDVNSSTARAVIDARMIDCTTGKILLAVSGKGEQKNTGISASKWDVGNIDFSNDEWEGSQLGKATKIAVAQVIENITNTFPIEATVKLVSSDGQVILDIGKLAGVKDGDVFELIREVQEKDEETGEVVFSERKVIGTLKVTELQDERCKCAFTAKKDDTPKKGDLAVLKRSIPKK